MTVVVTLPVRFADCDPAGIAYFPRLLELVDAGVEDWTALVLGVTRAAMHGALRLGLPTVDLNVSFAAPCRLGEMLEVAVEHEAVGASSIAIVVTATVAGAPRFSARLKQVLMALDTARATPWPPDWRARLA